MSNSQKVRVPNFMPSEKTHLMRIIANKYASTLEDKKTDRASTSQKEKAWEAIENEFNASSSSAIHRNAASLKKCFENRKKELRKSLAEERKQRMLTGGGPPPKIKKDETDNILISILNKKTLEGLYNCFDDDADKSAIELNQPENKDIIFEYDVETDEGKDNETFSQALQSTITTAIDTEALKKVTQAVPIISRPKVNLEHKNYDNNWKKYTPRQLQSPISVPLVFSGQESGKTTGGDSTTPKKNASRRRPTTVIKPMTSSDIAKKYDLLLDKRLQLINGQLKNMKTENILVKRKLKLEIEILEIELAKKKKECNILQ